MPTRQQATGRTVARNVHPRLPPSAAPLRLNPAAAVGRVTDVGRSEDRRSREDRVRDGRDRRGTPPFGPRAGRYSACAASSVSARGARSLASTRSAAGIGAPSCGPGPARGDRPNRPAQRWISSHRSRPTISTSASIRCSASIVGQVVDIHLLPSVGRVWRFSMTTTGDYWVTSDIPGAPGVSRPSEPRRAGEAARRRAAATLRSHPSSPPPLPPQCLVPPA